MEIESYYVSIKIVNYNFQKFIIDADAKEK